MKNILSLFIFCISLVLAVIFTGIIPKPSFIREAAKSCPFELNASKMPVMVVRVIDNSSLPKDFVRRCLLQKMTDEEGIVFINRENEPQILGELARQSQIPASAEAIQPIGEILVPTHLYVINEKENWVGISLSEVKSGVFIFTEEFKFNPVLEKMKENSLLLFRLITGGISFLILLIVLRVLTSPLYNWFQRRKEIEDINTKFDQAKKLIAANNIKTAGTLLVECAKSELDCRGKQASLNLLKHLATNLKG